MLEPTEKSETLEEVWGEDPRRFEVHPACCYQLTGTPGWLFLSKITRGKDSFLLCIQPSDSALFGDWILFWPFVNKDNIIYYSYISVVRRRALQVADLILCSSDTWPRHHSECCCFPWKQGLNWKESLSSLPEISLSSWEELSFLSCEAEVSCKTDWRILSWRMTTKAMFRVAKYRGKSKGKQLVRAMETKLYILLDIFQNKGLENNLCKMPIRSLTYLN